MAPDFPLITTAKAPTPCKIVSSGRIAFIFTRMGGTFYNIRRMIPHSNDSPGLAGKLKLLLAIVVGHLLFSSLPSAAQPDDAESHQGYPRYRTSHSLELVRSGATIRDDFEESEIKGKLWRVWISNPGQARVEQSEGRLWVRVSGSVGYNGLVSRVNLATRDVVAVCRTGLESDDGARHASIVHLCGSGEWSPDHWYEISLQDMRGEFTRATSAIAVPPRYREGYRGKYDLPHPASGGHLVRVTCESSSQQCRGFVLVEDEWWQIGDAFEVPARGSRLEIKTSGTLSGPGSSVIWFDDCRVYPSPENHYVTIKLQRADGSMPGRRSNNTGEQVCLDAMNRPIQDCGFSIDLHTADGSVLVDSADTGTGYGFGLLRLNAPAWDVFPVAAVVRVHANGRQLGPDHIIEMKGVDGLYPDDIYTLTLE